MGRLRSRTDHGAAGDLQGRLLDDFERKPMKLKPQFLAACLAGVFAVSAQAQVSGTGLYVGGSAGQSKWKGGDFPGLDST